jgi:CrcB protein
VEQPVDNQEELTGRMTLTAPVGQVVAIAVGGAVGSVLRYGMSTWVHHWAGRGFPYGTLTVNAVGCLLMGVLFVLFTERLSDSNVLRAGMLIGVLGGFTTFSTFSIETFNLIEEGAWLRATVNAASSLLLCLGGTWLGVWIGRQI